MARLMVKITDLIGLMLEIILYSACSVLISALSKLQRQRAREEAERDEDDDFVETDLELEGKTGIISSINDTHHNRQHYQIVQQGKKAQNHIQKQAYTRRP